MARTQDMVHTGRPQAAQITYLNELVDDLTALRTAITTLTAKLDLDGGVTDVNYASLCNPAALKTKK